MTALPSTPCLVETVVAAPTGWLGALSVDVETNPAEADRIFRIGAVRSDTAAALDLPTGRQATAEATRRLDALAAGARCIVGHNLRRHDLPRLAEQFPGLSCTALPLIDTLELSALAFPRNPYHRLVKGYKLLSDARNEPLKDARLTLSLLGDEIEAFERMHASDAPWVAWLHHLLRHEPALDRLFSRVRETGAPDAGAAARGARAGFAGMCCDTRLDLVLQQGLAAGPEEGWAIAYALGWVRVSGGNSVLPAWVHAVVPAVRGLIHDLREVDCRSPACPYCVRQHDPEGLLRHHFGKPGFRALPASADGQSLQRQIVVAGLARESLLAVLPTGGGKSIGYQLPALAHYWRSGRLTVIVSPLQSLMKDQVDNLIGNGVQSAVTINGLLTPLERRAALDKIRLGDASIVLVSPEQFRNRSFAEAIRMRQIATWVFDEAHCLSKWGQDFRTDYLYVARFIRENFAAAQAPVACFTATAKPDVIDDLALHFRLALGLELQTFPGGHERSNLAYLVVPVTQAEKAQRIIEMLPGELRDGGAAVVFCATRRATESFAELIGASGLRCAHFHGGLPPNDKKEIQRAFIAGELQVITATNAFGMGVDKPDIRVVVHADIPGSLENYLQEAGRAGRDGAPAKCVLLFDEQDVEAQFRLSAGSQLTPRDFAGLLKGIRRRVERFKSPEIVVSARELLAESEGTEIDVDAPDASTKVTTAVAWLERSGFLRRNENRSRVFPASLRVATLEDALARIAAASLPKRARGHYEALAAALFRNVSAEGLSTDDLMLAAGIPPEDCFRILHALETLGIVANDLGLKAAISKGVTGASDLELTRLDRLERELLALMAEQAPDADAGEWQLLGLRSVCSELRRRLDLPEGDASTHPDKVRKCLRSMAESFGSGTDKRSMLQVRSAGADSLRVTLLRPWSQIRRICGVRRATAQAVLNALLAVLPPGTKQSNFIVECKAKSLLDAIDGDLELRGIVKEPALALEHALLYLHENGIVQLDKGRAVFRAAMTIELLSESAKRRFLKEDFAPLQDHYRERMLQTHVMHEYAKLGADSIDAARALVAAYFSWPRRRFVREYFKGRTELLELATTDESFRRIVDALDHPVQEALVQQDGPANTLVLAGPGSGKTRVIVHRMAYLLRVRRVAPDRIIALAFNRSAALALRRRLAALVGDDARGVTILTYHAMALRLTGTSLDRVDRQGAAIDFDRLIQDAIDLLEGRSDAFGGADDARERLLQGYEYIFVDEYQDIDERQYALVSALAGRRSPDADGRLRVMAVGDDDQNIYAFKGASVAFIRRFQRDYPGEAAFLVENFRSTQSIILAANHVIQRAAERMKVDHPIRIDARRIDDPPGGRWATLDAQDGGAVRLIAAPVDANLQVQLVLDEVRRLERLDPGTRRGDIAVLARSHAALQVMRALCEAEGIRIVMQPREGGGGSLGLMASREGRRVLDALRGHRRGLLSLKGLCRWLARRARPAALNPFWGDLCSAAEEFRASSPATRVAPTEAIEWFHEFAADSRRDGAPDALRLLTAHGAKGQEFRHVIVMDCGDWKRSGDDERRLLYVAMTRAKETLTLFKPEDGRSPFLVDLAGLEGVLSLLPPVRPTARADLQRDFVDLGPADVDLGFAGRQVGGAAIHARIAAVEVGSAIRLAGNRLLTADGQQVGRVASKWALADDRTLHGVVTGVMVRTRAQTPAKYLAATRVDRWEVVLAEFIGPAERR